MIALPTTGGIYLYIQPTDMRKSFSGLAGIVRNDMGKTPNDGSLFLFINRRQDKLKSLYWDRDGMALWYKSLESGSLERICRPDIWAQTHSESIRAYRQRERQCTTFAATANAAYRITAPVPSEIGV